MTRGLIQRIMVSEREAKSTVEAAREEAERIVADAKRQAHALTSRIRQENRRAREEAIEAAVEAGRREKEDRLAQAAREIDQAVSLDEQTRQRIIAAVVRCACGSQEGEQQR